MGLHQNCTKIYHRYKNNSEEANAALAELVGDASFELATPAV
jgi:hypothetical protein